MIGAFSSLKSLVTFSQISIDNGVFILHYKVTVLVLLVCTMMISCKQHFGEPITCLADNADVKFGKAIDAYCWGKRIDKHFRNNVTILFLNLVHSTYTVNELLDGRPGKIRITNKLSFCPNVCLLIRKWHNEKILPQEETLFNRVLASIHLQRLNEF